MSKFDFEYGELNEVSKRNFNTRMDISDPISTIVNTSRDMMSVNAPITGPFRGVVLRVDVEQMSFWQAIGSALTGGEASWSCKVRVPELDSHLPLPEPDAPDSLPDNQTVKSELYRKYSAVNRHYTYFPRVKGMAKPEKGDIVWVDVINGQRFVIDSSRENSGGQRGDGNGGSGSGRPSPPQSVPTPDSQASPRTAQNVDKTEAEKFITRLNRDHGREIIPVARALEFVKFDILTKTYDGVELTLHRDHHSVFEKFRNDFANAFESITGQKVFPEFKNKEGYRLVRSGGGHHFSTSAGSTHTKGIAIDMKIPSGSLLQKRNYVMLLQKIAMQNGYNAFGVGVNTFHIDLRGSSSYWVYNTRSKEEIAKEEGRSEKERKFKSAKSGKKIPIPEAWVDHTWAYQKIVKDITDWNHRTVNRVDMAGRS